MYLCSIVSTVKLHAANADYYDFQSFCFSKVLKSLFSEITGSTRIGHLAATVTRTPQPIPRRDIMPPEHNAVGK